MNVPKGRREYVLSAAVVFLLTAIPIILTPFPPATDLPQHIAQVQLAVKAAADPSGPYVILWGAPNTLVYAFIYPLMRIFSPDFLARAILLFMTGAWIIAIFFTAAQRKRPVESALLGSLLLFNVSFYWGFLNFMIGFPVFMAWFFITTRNRKGSSWKAVVPFVLGSALLYSGHVLWFAAGAVWLGLISLLRRLPFRVLILRAATLVPVGLAALFWFRKFAAYQGASGLDKRSEWYDRPFEKLLSPWFKDQAFGGATGWIETILFFLVLAWIGYALVSNRRELRAKLDTDLLAAAVFLLAVSFFAPDTIKNTIYFSGRWAAVSFIFLLLALPVPRLKPGIRRAFGWTALVVFYLATTFQWIHFNRTEMAGFAESLARIPRASRVLGLDYIKRSRYLDFWPFLQMYAYAQVFNDAELAYPFPRHSTGLVAYRKPAVSPWTPRLDWYAERVKESDFDFFDYVLVNGSPYDHGHNLPRRRLTPVTTSGRWRLYRIDRDSGGVGGR